MKSALLLTLCITVIVSAEGFKKHSVILSGGFPTLAEAAYEYGLTANDKIGVSAGLLVFFPEYEVNYTRLQGGLELIGSVGIITGELDIDDDFFDFEENAELRIMTATASTGYRHTADSGFIFHVSGCAKCLFGTDGDGTAVVPGLHAGIGLAL